LIEQSVTPAFNVIWSYNPTGTWISRHQMSNNGKHDDFTRADLLAVAETYGIKDGWVRLSR
jgi:serine/threonine-protein kinase HipA